MMSKTAADSVMPVRPRTDDADAWKAYWRALGMPWRADPEIDPERQRYLAKRRASSVEIERGLYPFRDADGRIPLTRADVEWLLATHESDGLRGPVDWHDPRQRGRLGLDLRGADLSQVDLHRMPLAGLRGSLSFEEAGEGTTDIVDLAAILLVHANLREAQLNGAELRRALLSGADLRGADLSRAELYNAFLEGARLGQSSLAGASVRRAVLSADTALYLTRLSDATYGSVRLRDIRWNGADLSVIDWAHVRALGDELIIRTRRRSRRNDYPNATRANRQLAVALRSQGLNEDADRFAYRAQRLQRRVLLQQRHLIRAFGSWLLDVVAGYGYRPIRSLIAYVIIICAFAAAYFALGDANGQALSWNEAIVISMTAFHGRGFFSAVFQPGDLQAAVAAIEAFIGLLIEIVLIATFTQRFFAR
jgi:hypothetical protein